MRALGINITYNHKEIAVAKVVLELVKLII